MKNTTRRLLELSLLTAVALIIFAVELQIPNPFPIPGIKLGLSNIVTVYAVYHYRWYEVSSIVLIRVVLGSVFSGNIMAMIYSLAGAVLCLVGMLLLKRIIDERHLWIASVFGALLHNTGQMIAALVILHTPQLIAYYPFLLLSGCLAGLFTGLCAQALVAKLDKINKDKI